MRRARSVRCASAAAGIMEVAKRIDCAVILVGHVTKEGAVAGPRVLEHLVDCVLFFEGERERSFRTLRALKNRFGATSEVGVFEMRSGGLVEVDDPSARFVAEASARAGLRRALLDGGHAAAAGRGAGAGRADRDRPAASRRQRVSTATGWRWCSRCSRATAARRWRAPTSSSTSPAACASTSRVPTSRSRSRSSPRTAAIALADASARPLACFGEIGLTGELRSVGHSERRLAEAVKFGLGPVVAPVVRRAAGRPRPPGDAADGDRGRPTGERQAGRRRGLAPRGRSRLTTAIPSFPHGIGRAAQGLRGFAIMDRCSTPGTS